MIPKDPFDTQRGPQGGVSYPERVSARISYEDYQTVTDIYRSLHSNDPRARYQSPSATEVLRFLLADWRDRNGG